jgi:multicomponent Na+:H+ antiporter subunit E
MSRRLLLLAWLALVWMLLWESATVANLVGGVVVAALLVAVFPPRDVGPIPVRPVAALRLLGHFVVKLVEANLFLAWEIITPGSRVKEGIVAVALDEERDGIIALVANTVSLTPGTLTIEVRRSPTVLYVHVLHLRSVEAARDDVLTFHRLVDAAFPDQERTR